MSDLYTLETAGAVPVSLEDMKAYMKVTSTADDDLITGMLSSATLWGENYTGRDFRANIWTLLKDKFTARICLRRDPVKTITSVKHLVSATLVAVASAVYYLKKNVQDSELLLNEDQEWPDDTDDREQVIEIVFVTESYRDADSIAQGIKRHVAFWYSNRGDCSDCGDAAKGSGVKTFYDAFRIVRI